MLPLLYYADCRLAATIFSPMPRMMPMLLIRGMLPWMLRFAATLLDAAFAVRRYADLPPPLLMLYYATRYCCC